jgi:adenosylcobinamide kinase/adenosylcobinamide-phosphate guanylyltransferase
MRVRLLGTGSADGWPNPFCHCASCDDSRRRNVHRHHTAALVDGRLLLDCGPDVPRAAQRFGEDLAGVEVVVVTHDHPDHLDPAPLLWRRWAHATVPLHVVGPPAATERCAAWVGPDDPVTFHPVRDGDVVELAGYRIHALAARHDGPEYGPAVVYAISDVADRHLLYLTDTGPLPATTVDALHGIGADLTLIEETFGTHTDHGTDHLDLATLPTEVARLDAVGATSRTGRVVAVHLSHHNPPLPELTRRLAEIGVEVLPDGAVLDTDRSGRRSGRTTLVLGGARSGKSTAAERWAAAADGRAVTYVATAPARPDDDEWTSRLADHRARRPASWRTLETDDVASVLRAATDADCILVDCLTLWLSGLLDHGGWSDEGNWLGDPHAVQSSIADLIDAWRTTAARAIAVSNEVGWGVVPATASGRLFRDWQGRLNRSMADASDETVLVVAGRLVPLSDVDASSTTILDGAR